MDDAAFEELVVAALDSLPEELQRMMNNVEVVIEDEPPARVLEGLGPGQTVFGYYEGYPLTGRRGYTSVMPDKISIYKGPLTRTFRRPDEITEEVRATVLHEVAHHFGIDEDRLEELGWG